MLFSCWFGYVCFVLGCVIDVVFYGLDSFIVRLIVLLVLYFLYLRLLIC